MGNHKPVFVAELCVDFIHANYTAQITQQTAQVIAQRLSNDNFIEK
jgi:hypothetical protein